MAITMPTGTFVWIASADSTHTSLSLPVPPGAAAGDVLVIAASAERAEIPVVRLNNATTGLTVVRSESSTNICAVFAWKRLGAAELTAPVTVTNSAARRQSLSLLLIKGANDPSFVNQPISLQASGVSAKTGPGWTPSADNALAVGLWAIARPITPYTGYSFTSTAPFVERTEATSAYATGINATTFTSSRLLGAGSSGIAQAGETIHCTTSPFDSMATVLVFSPQASVGNPQPHISILQPMAVIDCTGTTAANGGALNFTISPSVGVIEHSEGYFAVPQTTVPQIYNVTIIETGGGSTISQVTVPALPSSGGTGGNGTGVEIVRWHSGGWV